MDLSGIAVSDQSPIMAGQNYAYCTLITRSSYLAGVLILAHTLAKYKSAYPLIVLYTDTLPASSVRALELEAPHSNLILHRVDALLPRENVHVHLIAERFADTWTKLRVFELYKLDNYDKICYLDADMILRKNMDHIFDKQLPADDWIAANHACVCNLDKDPWAPEDWTKENCAYTAVSHPGALDHPTPITPDSRGTYHLLNSGMFLFIASEQLWDRMIDFFNTTPLLGEFKFPDQDFLAEFFKNKWMSLGWQFNALKTMRYWHENIWRDDEVVCLHYIVDKPWAKRVSEDGVAGYLGRDGETHTWWWQEYEDWHQQRKSQNETEELEIAEKHVAKPIGQEDQETDEMRAIGSGVQSFANNKKPGQSKEDEKKQVANGDKEEDLPQPQIPAPHELKGKVLGERGHGPRVRG
ncbi:nucleotide-diphospho-sugar transferase, partial [Aureobasidium melanogenum]